MTKRLIAIALLALSSRVGAQDVSVLTLSGLGGKPQGVTIADLRRIGPQALQATDPHSKQAGAYQAVSLVKVLALVNAPFGDQLKGDAFAAYVLVEARDDYRVIFSLVELDAKTAGTEAFVAFEKDGQPLPSGMGPLRLVVPTDRRGARWVREVTRISVATAAKQP
jgi:DMSO/TMAO reductase YedYZ molybdopterin-dependent catalytic subunit